MSGNTITLGEPDMQKAKMYGIRFSSEVLDPVAVLRAFVDFSAIPDDPLKPFVKVEMPCCKQTFAFWSEEDFPRETMPCPCGAENHWVVFYEEAA